MFTMFLLLQAASGAAEPAPKPKNDPDKVICRSMGDTGTRLGGRRVCRTRAEWAFAEREQQQATGQAQANARRN